MQQASSVNKVSRLVVKIFDHQNDSIPWESIHEGAINFSHHLPTQYIEKRLDSIRARVAEGFVQAVVAYKGYAYAGSIFFSKQRPNIMRVAIGGIAEASVNNERAVFEALFQTLHNLDGQQDLICGTPESIRAGFQPFFNEHGFKHDSSAKPSSLEIKHTFQDQDAETYAWFRKEYNARNH